MYIFLVFYKVVDRRDSLVDSRRRQEAPMGVCEVDEVPADAVGRRVACGTERATVRYVGAVPPTEGTV